MFGSAENGFPEIKECFIAMTAGIISRHNIFGEYYLWHFRSYHKNRQVSIETCRFFNEIRSVGTSEVHLPMC